MRRAHRRAHMVLWLTVGPLALLGLLLALRARQLPPSQAPVVEPQLTPGRPPVVEPTAPAAEAGR